MATTVERPNKIDERTPAAGGGSDHGGFFTEDGNLHLVLDRRSPHPSSTAVYVALAGIGMIFAALTSALVVRKGGATDWKSFTLPSILYVNTLVLLASGFVLEIGRACRWKVHDGSRPPARENNVLVLSQSRAGIGVRRRTIPCVAATSA